MAAYAFSRLRWRGRNAVFSLFLATMMVPPIFTALPNFLLIKNLGLLNTMLGMVLPYLFMTPFAIFFLRQFFLNMSREVEEAAMLDGAKHLRIFFQIVLPNAAAPIATLALLTFIGQWNEYFWPLLVGNQDETSASSLSAWASSSPSRPRAPRTGPASWPPPSSLPCRSCCSSSPSARGSSTPSASPASSNPDPDTQCWTFQHALPSKKQCP